jgi:1-acyl-sn-glycerol-3-phosphate acyltransferase
MKLFIRSLAFNIVLFGVGVGLGLWVRVVTQSKGASYITGIGQTWSRISLRALREICDIRIAVEGREFLPQSGPALIAAQHQSAFDILLWLTLLPAPAYVMKQELVEIPLLGALLPKSGFIPVDRDGGGASLRKMVTECRKAAAAGRQIVIFPEGTRVAPGERGIIQPGVVALARALNLPVIPASTNSGLHWGKRAFKKTPGTVTVTLHPPATETFQRRDLLPSLAQIYYGDPGDNTVR